MTPPSLRNVLLLGITLSLAGALRPSAARAAVAEPARADDAELTRATMRCTRLMDLVACDDALNRRPNSPELLVAEADALLQLKRPGEAIGVYRNALTVGAKRAALEPRIAGARKLRWSLLQTCLTRHGVAAEQACEAAWLPGTRDEVDVFKRRGVLLQTSGASSAAFDAYLAAARLAPRDRSVARAIVALAPVAGRKDAASLAAIAAARDQLHAAERSAHGGAAAGTRTHAAAALVAPRAMTARAPAAPPESYSNEAEATRSN